MTKSAHVMLMGQGAEIFAAEQGLELVDRPISTRSTAGTSCNGPLLKKACYAITIFQVHRSLKRMKSAERSAPWPWIATVISQPVHRMEGSRTNALGAWGIHQSPARETTPTIARLRYPPPAPEKCSFALLPPSTLPLKCDCCVRQLLRLSITRWRKSRPLAVMVV
jgi:hypothetical protein